MDDSTLALMRRKEMVGIVAGCLWAYAVGAAVGIVPSGPCGDLGTSALIVAWGLTAAWVAIDASVRQSHMALWALLTLATGPVGFLLYWVANPPITPVCSSCGAQLPERYARCPACGNLSPASRIVSAERRARSEVLRSLTSGPIERNRDTARQMAFALGGVAIAGTIGMPVLSSVDYRLRSFLILAYIISIAGYWVLAAWWVYLDAAWRRMDAIPWAVLTLVTNVVGLVTYLVIRYPDPRVCSRCGASLATGLKRCPYCGTEAEPSCPRCQAPVRPDWVFCPACSVRLSSVGAPPDEVPMVAQPEVRAMLSASGTVVDASTGAPVEGAEVRVDSRGESPSTWTDARGRFLLSGLEPRVYVLIASAEGYTSQAKALAPDSAGRGILHFALRSAATQEKLTQPLNGLFGVGECRPEPDMPKE